MVKSAEILGGGIQSERPPIAPLSGRKVLIAEDEVIIAMELAAIMEESGATVVGPAHTLKFALDIAEREDLSAAILDLRLGRHSIDVVAEALTARGVPFIFYSGQLPGDTLADRWPRTPFVTKPARPKHLVDTVARLVTQPGPNSTIAG